MNTPSDSARTFRALIPRPNPVWRFVGLLVAAISLSCLGVSSALAAPIILNSSETAAPGDTVFVQGENFGAGAQLWFRRILTTDTTIAPTTQLTLITSSTRALSAALPKTMPMGLYALWVKDSGGTNSAPVFVNRARAMTFEYPEISPGYTFRIFGRNLRLPGATPAVTFVNGATNLAATVVTAYSYNDGYELQVQAPASIVPGTTYTIKVSNGHGHNATANFDVTTADSTLPARAGGADPFNLGVPWGPDFAAIAANVIDVTQPPYNADSSGATNALAAIQSALANAGNATLNPNGATVYLPAGTYKITMTSGSGLNIKSKVVLKGAGIGQTIISDTSTYWGSVAIALGAGGTNASLSGLTGLTYRHDMVVTTDGAPNSVRNLSSGSSKVFFTNVHFDMDVAFLDTGNKDTSKAQMGVVIPQAANNTKVLVQGCTFQKCRWGNQNNPKPNTYGRDYIIRNNTFLSWYARINMGYMDNMLVEGNQLTRDGQVPTATFPYPAAVNGLTNGGMEFTGRDITVLRNAYNAINLPLAAHNDGETILTQNFYKDSEYDFGAPTSATATTLTNSARAWPVGVYEGQTWPNGFYAGKMVAIIKGPGTGQVRFIASSTPTTITVVAPWEVQPTTASTYALMPANAYRYLIKGNSLSSVPRGIAMYCGSYDSAFIGNFVADANWSVYLRADHRIDPTATYNPVPKWRIGILGRNIVADNTAVNTLNTWPSVIAGELHLVHRHAVIGTPVFANEFRRNLVEASAGADLTEGTLKEGTRNHGHDDVTAATFVETNTAGLLATVFDDNVSINADNTYYLNTHTYQTSIRNQLNLGVTSAVSSATLPGASHSAVGTYQNDDPVIQRANMSGTGTSTGGATDLLESGGNGSLIAGAGGNTVAISSTTPFTGTSGSYVRFTRVAAGTNAARVQTTPLMPHTSWGRLFTLRSGEWQLNGAFDFFWRPAQTPTASGSMRPIDLGNTPNGLRITFYNTSATNLRSEIITPAGGGGVILNGSYPAGFAANQVYHLGATFTTNPATGVTTMKMYAVPGTGAIDTTALTSQIGSISFTINPTIVTNTTGWLGGDPWRLGDAGVVTGTTINDYDRVTLYYKDPGSFPAL